MVNPVHKPTPWYPPVLFDLVSSCIIWPGILLYYLTWHPPVLFDLVSSCIIWPGILLYYLTWYLPVLFDLVCAVLGNKSRASGSSFNTVFNKRTSRTSLGIRSVQMSEKSSGSNAYEFFRYKYIGIRPVVIFQNLSGVIFKNLSGRIRLIVKYKNSSVSNISEFVRY